MKKLLYTILFSTIVTFSNGQEVEYKVVDLDIHDNYTTIEIKDSLIFALTRDYNLSVWDIKNIKLKTCLEIENSSISCLAKDNNDNIVVGTYSGDLYLINDKLKFELIASNDYSIFNIIFNSKNEPYIQNGHNLHKLNTKFNWDCFPHSDTNFQYSGERYCTLFLPTYIYNDDKGFHYFLTDDGEWGNDIQVFNSSEEEPINWRMSPIGKLSSTPLAIAQNSQNEYLVQTGNKLDTMYFSFIDKFGNISECVSINNLHIESPQKKDTSFFQDGVFNIVHERIVLYQIDYDCKKLIHANKNEYYLLLNAGLYSLKLNEDHSGSELRSIILFEPGVRSSEKEYTKLFPEEGILFYYQNSLIFLDRFNGIVIYNDENKVIVLN